jgi:hypothetical protein
MFLQSHERLYYQRGTLRCVLHQSSAIQAELFTKIHRMEINLTYGEQDMVARVYG